MKARKNQMSELKFKLTEEFLDLGDVKLYRIEALISFRNVQVGEKGGFVEIEKAQNNNQRWIDSLRDRKGW
jgi:hypothetical protein